jgi:hypothetical protein
MLNKHFAQGRRIGGRPLLRDDLAERAPFPLFRHTFPPKSGGEEGGKVVGETGRPPLSLRGGVMKERGGDGYGRLPAATYLLPRVFPQGGTDVTGANSRARLVGQAGAAA